MRIYNRSQMPTSQCFKCHKSLTLSEGKLSFRAICDHCNTYLHCCKNCEHYKLGLANDCKIPGTEPIADRFGCNYCEEFDMRKDALNGAIKDFQQSLNKYPKESRDAFDDLFKS